MNLFYSCFASRVYFLFYFEAILLVCLLLCYFLSCYQHLPLWFTYVQLSLQPPLCIWCLCFQSSVSVCLLVQLCSIVFCFLIVTVFVFGLHSSEPYLWIQYFELLLSTCIRIQKTSQRVTAQSSYRLIKNKILSCRCLFEYIKKVYGPFLIFFYFVNLPHLHVSDYQSNLHIGHGKHNIQFLTFNFNIWKKKKNIYLTLSLYEKVITPSVSWLTNWPNVIDSGFKAIYKSYRNRKVFLRWCKSSFEVFWYLQLYQCKTKTLYFYSIWRTNRMFEGRPLSPQEHRMLDSSNNKRPSVMANTRAFTISSLIHQPLGYGPSIPPQHHLALRLIGFLS